MGRALFSTYTSEPAIRTEPEPKVDTCERWSAWNRFDPDSEEFFQNAQYEAFVDPTQAPVPPPVLRASGSLSEASETSEAGVDDQTSPLAFGFDDPAFLRVITDASRSRDSWESHGDAESLTGPDRDWLPWVARISSPTPLSPITYAPLHSLPDVDHLSSEPSGGNATPPFIPPSMFREPSPAIDSERNTGRDIPAPPAMRRTVSITPISVPVVRPEEDMHSGSSSPSTSSPPSTPPMRASYPHTSPGHIALTPSPAPSVTPRYYHWNDSNASWASSPVPARHRAQMDSPLAHSRVRTSFARLESSPVALTTLGR